MSFLEGMQEMARQMEIPPHPLHTEDLSVRYPYTLGIALLLARADDDFTQQEQAWLDDFILSMDLPERLSSKILPEAQSARPEVLHNILPLLAEPRLKKHFLEDLQRAAAADGTVSKQEKEMIATYQRLLNAVDPAGTPQKHPTATAQKEKPSVVTNLQTVARQHTCELSYCQDRLDYSHLHDITSVLRDKKILCFRSCHRRKRIEREVI